MHSCSTSWVWHSVRNGAGRPPAARGFFDLPYTRGMNNPARYLAAAALLATLAACGNKGPLVRASAATSAATVPSPAASDPTGTAPVEGVSPPPAADPPAATPPASTPPATPPAGGGNG